jgi:hypothetical protein
MTGTMGPRLATTNWTRIENLNLPSKGALTATPAAPRLKLRKTPAPKPLAAPGTTVTLRTFRVAA